MASIANFSGDYNLGLQVAQNFGTINYNAPQASDCHQLFRLANESGGGYEWYKNRIEERVAGTCQWFLKHEDYGSWKERSFGPLLVSADPGCGKSVLAKHLVDHELPGTVCYFFFKDEDQNTIKQALCALLHQLFARKPSLLRYAIPKYLENGPMLVDLTDSLWDILQEAIHDTEAGPVTIVLDALDECASSDLKDLIQKLTRQYLCGTTEQSKIKFLLTSRPYQDVIVEFWELLDAFPEIRIPGEEHSTEIGKEVNCVIEHRVVQLSKKFKLKKELAEHLKKRLQDISHRTYLWTYLIFDLLSNGFKKTLKGIENSINTLPESVNQAYEKILQRSTNSQNARKALSIILAAARPLTLQEMNIAINIEPSSEATCIEDLDLEEEEDFKDTLREWCGLLISIYGGKIYFLHQTAREFLLASPSLSPIQSWQWYASMNPQQSHSLLAHICTVYINFTNFEVDISPTQFTLEDEDHPFHKYVFFDYSALYWVEHFRRAGLQRPVSILLLTENVNYRDKAKKSALHVASWKGCEAVIRLLLERGAEVNTQDQEGETALCTASEQGHEAVVRLLLDQGAEVNTQNQWGGTALSVASRSGYEAVARLLLERGAEVNTQNQWGETALSIASRRGYEAVARLLLERGVEINTQDHTGETALSIASRRKHEAVVRLLLERGARR